MKHRSRLARPVAGASLLLGIAAAGGSALASQSDAVDPPSPASGHAQVVATWLVNFEAGRVVWNVVEHQVDAAGIDLTHTAPTFLIGDGENSTVITGPEVRGRLADGEALFRRPTLTTHAAAVGGEPATLMEWTIGAEDTGPGSDPFEPGAGAHDIDIVRDWLAPGETFTMKAGIPAFVMVTSGWVTTADGTRIDEGAWATLQGDIALTNGGDQPAVLLATWISPVIELPEAPAASTTTSIAPSTTTAPAPTAAPTTVAAPEVTAPPTIAPVTTSAPVTTVVEATTTTWPSTTIAETTTTWPATTTTWPTSETTEP